MRLIKYIKKGKELTRKAILGLLWVPVVAGFTACNDMEPLNPEEETPEGMVKVSFLIPNYEGNASTFGTRAYNTEEEGYMSNLYVIAIKYSNFEEVAKVDDSGTETKETPLGTPQVYTFSLNPVGVDFKVGAKDYQAFNVTLFPGKYKFAVVSNVDLYLSRTTKISNFTKEEDLRNIVLNFTEDTPLVPTHLPMVCLPEEIKYSHTDENGTAYGEIQSVDKDTPLVGIYKNQSARIYADMKFLCAKVRYTILFDKTAGGISESFGSSWIRFNVDDTNKPTAHNIRRQTLLLNDLGEEEKNANTGYDPNTYFVHHDETSGDQSGAWFVNIDRFKWSTTEGASYPKTPNSSLELWTGSTEEWIPQTQKVWQGVVYLPENKLANITETDDAGNQTVTVNKTYLEFPYHTKANDLDDTPWLEASTPKRMYFFGNAGEKHYGGVNSNDEYQTNETLFTGLERNYFYDVVVKVVNPDTEEMDIRVFVSILRWHETDQDLEEGWLYNNNEKSATQFMGRMSPWDYNDVTNVW